MTFDDLLVGTAVFFDANCLVYAATADPRFGPACQHLLRRIENGEFAGFTSAHVVAELAPRLMTIEAATVFNRPLAGMANWLGRHPAEVQQLTRYRPAIDDLAAIPIAILPIVGAQVSRSADLGRQHGLLMNDNRLSHLASADADFDRVGGITRYAPV